MNHFICKLGSHRPPADRGRDRGPGACATGRWRGRLARGRLRLTTGALLVLGAAVAVPAMSAATYHVNSQAGNASDANAGTGQAPWRTIARAGSARELKPGDVVLIHSGVYREHVEIKVSGENGRPILFSAAPNARVVVKGSEILRGPWKRWSDSPDRKEPYPAAFDGVWMVSLGDAYFADPRSKDFFANKARRYVSQVFVNDDKPLQQIGEDPIYTKPNRVWLPAVGRGLTDLFRNSFYFDPANQTLYVKIDGDPAWSCYEVGVRRYVLTAEGVHDVVVRGLEMKHNRQPGGQWPMVSLYRCARVVFEGCRFARADFAGLTVNLSTNCVVRDCDLSENGSTGLSLANCLECVVENCTLLFNNYRRFNSGWHAGGMKCIPQNRRCTVRGCEVAYNLASSGIWFDTDNTDIRILGNVCHHNGDTGICYEANPDGAVIADNLVYANRDRGIFVSGSQNTWVVHNTVAANRGGIVCMSRGDAWPLKNVHLLNNLLLDNALPVEHGARGSDLTLDMGCPENGPFVRRDQTSHSDYNVFNNGAIPPTLRHSWNPENTLAQWRTRFDEDTHSKPLAVPYQIRGTGFRLNRGAGLDTAGPLPTELLWRPSTAKWVGSSLVQWP